MAAGGTGSKLPFAFLTNQDARKYLNLTELMTSLEMALSSFSASRGTVVQPVRSGIPVEKNNGLLLVMPAYVADVEALAVKLVSVYPGNVQLPSHVASVLLFDESTGALKAMIEGEYITELRTAAASAVASKYLARKDSRVLAVLGAGHQGHIHTEVLNRIYNFKEIRVWSRSLESASRLAQKYACAKPCETVEEATHDADIICTTSLSQTPILYKDHVKQGAHINAVGAARPDQQELDPGLMRSAVVYTDSVEACLKEAGDVILSKCEVQGEIGDVINNKVKAFPEKITVFKSLGCALEDAVSAKIIYKNYLQSKETEETT